MSARQDADALTMPVLERAALRYLERYASSRATLRRVLLRRVAKAARGDEEKAAAGRALVEALIERYVQSGLLDDARYAEAKAGGLARAGASRYRIRGKLMQKGVAADHIADAIAALDERGEGSEPAAAGALIRKKRLGPYRRPGDRAKFRDKDLAALARAGFALGLARRLLGAPDVETLERMAGGEE
ncbi:MAG TPA: RecX family transcriptional regulator [Stellaceae bacterium]|nr:RecX family transcriptional regulator [Stellaceae bacterium]